MLLVAKTPQITVAIAKDVSEALDDYCERRASVKKQIVSRVMDWFLKQPDTVQSVIIGVDAEVGPAYASVLMRLAQQAKGVREPSGNRIAAATNIPTLNPEDVPEGKYRRK